MTTGDFERSFRVEIVSKNLWMCVWIYLFYIGEIVAIT